MPPHPADLLPRFQQLAPEDGGLRPGESVLLALSGGLDSVVLLDLLLRSNEQSPRRIEALHLDHRLRAASALDRRHCEELCAAHAIPLHVHEIDVAPRAAASGLGIEATARSIRYASLGSTREALGLDVVATAHHRDDHVETLLLWLFRGTGLRGMQGIRHRSPWLIRPLRELGRQEIADYAAWRQLVWREDESNTSPQFRRNRVRHELLPSIAAIFGPTADQRLVAFAARAAEDLSLLEELAGELLGSLQIPDTEGRVRLSLPAWRDLDPRLQRLCLRQLLPLGGRRSDAPQRLAASDWQRLADFAQSAAAGRSQPIPGGGWLRVGRAEIEFEAVLSAPLPAQLQIESLPPQGTMLNFGEQIAYFDADQLRLPLRVRAILPGDRMRTSGTQGRKRLVDLLREGGVPSWRRSRSLVVEGPDRILWAVGHAVDATSRPTGHTQRVLRVSIASRSESPTRKDPCP